jgi:hypothetical protein
LRRGRHQKEAKIEANKSMTETGRKMPTLFKLRMLRRITGIGMNLITKSENG